MQTCSVKGCKRKFHQNRGGKPYCGRHYAQLYYHGKILKRTMFDPNEIIVKGDIAEIVLYNNKNKEVARAIIDAEDAEKVRKYKWCLVGGRVATRPSGKPIEIQHVVLGMKANMEIHIDHRNRNPLNNRKQNLRKCTNTENARNSGKSKANTSGFKGVFKHRKNWRAQIMVNRKSIHLGCFTDKLKAAQAYNSAAVKHFGGFACLNQL